MSEHRGYLSDTVKQKAIELLGYEISQTELRLMPYIQYVMVNEQKINPNNISSEERRILSVWREKGYIEGGAGGLFITKEFWDIINELIFISSVECI